MLWSSSFKKHTVLFFLFAFNTIKKKKKFITPNTPYPIADSCSCFHAVISPPKKLED